MPLKTFFSGLLLLALPMVGASGQETRVTILADAFGRRADLRMDWGYAALVEHDGRRILFDTGNDAELLKHNVEKLGVDLRDLDLVVVSHRHGDHTDGLRYLLDINPGVEIFAPDDEYFGGPTPRIFFAQPVDSLPRHMRYFDGRPPEVIPHGSPWKGARIRRVTGSLEIAPGVRVVANRSRSGAFTETPELSLAIETPEGQVVLTGCSHPGIEPILESLDAATRPVRLLVGGLHWLTSSPEQVEQAARALRTRWNVASVAPGHCTGEVGFAVLQRIYGREYVYAGLGSVLRVGR